MPVEFMSLFGAIPERLYLAWHAGTVKTTETAPRWKKSHKSR